MHLAIRPDNSFNPDAGTARNAGPGEDQLKSYVADIARRIRSNWFHDGLRELRVDHILTTNYDYAPGDGATSGTAVAGSTETRYGLFRCHKGDHRKTVWHIHGEAAAPDTILLGHDHYVRYSGRIQEYLRPSLRYPPASRILTLSG